MVILVVLDGEKSMRNLRIVFFLPYQMTHNLYLKVEIRISEK